MPVIITGVILLAVDCCGLGGMPNARENLRDEQGGTKAPHQDGDVPVDRAVGVEAHLAKGL